ncbi:hypothetical protein [Metabacillus indicus]|uniref:hypothetical protein n=1 Tax=Metabacillus indicus TaxID=246786 RepID=UPI00249180DD|nr:hypothetical protein [Metabacillus indicus]
MKKVTLFLMTALFAFLLSGCRDEDEGRDRRLVAAEDMLEAILEEDEREMKDLYLKGAYHTPEELISLKKKWGIDNLELKDFDFQEESFYVYRAYYDQDDQTERKAIVLRVRETEDDRIIVDFVDQITEKNKSDE